MARKLLIISLGILLFACNQSQEESIVNDTELKDSTIHIDETITKKDNSIHPMEVLFEENGLVDIERVIPSIKVDVRYGTEDNFMGINLYEGFQKVYVQKDVADRLKLANEALQEINPDLTLLAYDGARPRHIQQMMWDSTKLPVEEKIKYLSNPKHGSIHNYGAAIDLSLYNTATGEALDMGTPYDYLGEEAYPVLENKLLMKAILTEEQVNNRKLLRKVLEEQNFKNIQTEWWHFNACTRNEAKKQYVMLELEDRHRHTELEELSEEDINIVFRVQLIISRRTLKKNAKELHGYPVWSYKEDSWNKYTTGMFQDFESALIMKDQVVKFTGLEGAFVVCFNNNKRIGIQEGIDLLQ